LCIKPNEKCQTQSIAHSITVRCPAKINETLSVGAPDSKGYHPIETTFQAVGLYDNLTLTTAVENTFRCDVELPGANTVVRVWNLLRELVKLPPMAVRLEKHIPAESGLGGGSSDAAGFLRGAERLSGCKIDGKALAEVAAAVGADVPFFLVGGRAEGRGYGEVLTPLADQPERWLLIVMPKVVCPTKAMYAKLDAAGRPRKVGNDFELVAPRECLDLIKRLRDLGSVRAGLTGSGSACFGYFESRSAADVAGTRFPGMWRRVVQTITRAETIS